MKHLLIDCDELVGPWVAERTGGQWCEGRGRTIGLYDDYPKQLLAGVLYEDYNGANIIAHIAAVEGRSWLTRKFLWTIFHYPFVQLNCTRITGIVPSCNEAARKFDEHLGFEREATLKNAHPGGDLIIYRMFRENCRWLKLKGTSHGQEQSTGNPGLRRTGDPVFEPLKVQ